MATQHSKIEPWSKITVLYPTNHKETKIRNYKKQVKLWSKLKKKVKVIKKTWIEPKITHTVHTLLRVYQ